MALIGLVRVSTDKQETARQHDALKEAGCIRIFEEKISGKTNVAERPALQAALGFMRDGDMLCVQEVDRLGRNLLEGLIMLTDLFERGYSVKVLDGIARGEHTERSLILDLAFALAEDRRRDIVKKTKNGLEAARKRGRIGGRRPVMSEAMTAQAVALRDKGFTIRQIQPHLTYRTAGGELRNPSVGAISQALKEHDGTAVEYGSKTDVNNGSTTGAEPVTVEEGTGQTAVEVTEEEYVRVPMADSYRAVVFSQGTEDMKRAVAQAEPRGKLWVVLAPVRTHEAMARMTVIGAPKAALAARQKYADRVTALSA